MVPWKEEMSDWVWGEQRTCSLQLDPTPLKFLSTPTDYQIMNLVIGESMLSTKHLAPGLW